MISIQGKLVGVGSYSDGEESAEIQLDNGGVVEIRGLSRNEVKALTPALFELVTLKIE